MKDAVTVCVRVRVTFRFMVRISVNDRFRITVRSGLGFKKVYKTKTL